MSEINLNFAGGSDPFAGSALAIGAGSSGISSISLPGIGVGLQFLSALEGLRQSRIQANLTSQLADINRRGAQAQLQALTGDKVSVQRRTVLESEVPPGARIISRSPFSNEVLIEETIRREGKEGLIDIGRRELDRAGEKLDLTFNTQRGLLESEQRVFQIQRLKQRGQEAAATGNVRLARAQFTQAARIESDAFAASNAGAGRSAFTRAFGQSHINRFATLQQQERGLAKEKLFNTQLATEADRRFSLNLNMLEGLFDIEQRGLEDARKKFELEATVQEQQLIGQLEAANAQEAAAKESSKFLGII